VLALLEEAAREVPAAPERLARAAGEQDPARLVHADRAGSGGRLGVRHEAAGGTLGAAAAHLDLCRAARTELPVVELRHGAQQ
jgi:hypothetical protein